MPQHTALLIGSVLIALIHPVLGVYYPLFHVYSSGDASASLNGKVLNFEVDGEGYGHCIEKHEGFPVSTFEADRLDLIDNDSHRVMFRPNFKFPFFGAEYSEMFVSSNGFITFAAYVQSPSTAIEDHLTAAPRIAALTHDLDPIMNLPLFDRSAKPKISVKHVTQETVAITFDEVWNQDGSGPSTFQVLLHCDGAIQIFYNQVNLTDTSEAVVGLSNGTEVLYSVQESDFGIPCTGSLDEATETDSTSQPTLEARPGWWDASGSTDLTSKPDEHDPESFDRPEYSIADSNQDAQLTVLSETFGNSSYLEAAENSTDPTLYFLSLEIDRAVNTQGSTMYMLAEDILSTASDYQRLLTSAAELLMLPERFGQSMLVTVFDRALNSGVSWADFRIVSSRYFTACDVGDKLEASQNLVLMAIGATQDTAELKQFVMDLVASVDVDQGLESVLHLGARNRIGPSSVTHWLLSFMKQSLISVVDEQMADSREAIETHADTSSDCPWSPDAIENRTGLEDSNNSTDPSLYFLGLLITREFETEGSSFDELVKLILLPVDDVQSLLKSAVELLMLPDRFGQDMLVVAFARALHSGATFSEFGEVSSRFLTACSLEEKVAASQDLVAMATSGSQEGDLNTVVKMFIQDLVKAVEPQYALESIMHLAVRHGLTPEEMTNLLLGFGMQPLVTTVSMQMGATQEALARHTPANCPWGLE